MRHKTFKIVALIGIIGNILIGISYFIVNNYASAIIHVASGIIFIPMYLDSKNYID
jgi:hypothetical protein